MKFLRRTHKDNIADYSYSCTDNSLVTRYMKGTWHYLQTLFPTYVAPNVISLVGLFLTIYAWSITYRYYDTHPIVTGIITILSTLTYLNLDAIDGIHARKTKNSSPIGELIDHGADSISTIFIGMTLCKVLGVSSSATWFFTSTLTLGFQRAHLMWLKNGNFTFSNLSGPSEMLLLYCIVIGVKLTGRFDNMFDSFVMLLTRYSHIAYYGMLFGNLVYLNTMREKYKYTANGISIVYILQFINSIFIDYYQPDSFSIVADCMVTSAVTFDLILNKMAKKDSSEWIVILAILLQFDKLIPCIASLIFICMNIYEISEHMKIPVFSTNINVYCNGVFDIFHLGHRKMLMKAHSHGTRLIVGVHSDASTESYKRVPYLNENERYESVKLSRNVTQVIEDAPLVITQEFIDQNNIHVVCCSSEYFSEENDANGYYKVPREMGILREIEYHGGISTSEIINRVKTR